MADRPSEVPVDERLPERIEGERLVLRRWTAGDVGAMAAIVERNIDHLRGYMPWIAFEPLSHGARLALEQEWEGRWRSGGDVTLAIELGGEIVGSTGLHRRQGPTTLEIGYWVDRDHTGQGIATESSRMLTSVGLRVPGIETIEIRHDRSNLASRRVPEKLGFTYVGDADVAASAPAETGVHCIWQMTADRWLDRAGVVGA